MNIAVVVRQVPDLIEPLDIAASGTALDLGAASFILNESDDHALEQAMLLKEAGGGTVTVVALDFGDVDNTLYTAAAKGADRIIKIPYEAGVRPAAQCAAAAYAEVIRGLGADLLLVGSYAHDELESTLAPLLAFQLGPAVRRRRARRPTGGGRGQCDGVQGVSRGGLGEDDRQAPGSLGDPGRRTAAALRAGQPHSRGHEDGQDQ